MPSSTACVDPEFETDLISPKARQNKIALYTQFVIGKISTGEDYIILQDVGRKVT